MGSIPKAQRVPERGQPCGAPDRRVNSSLISDPTRMNPTEACMRARMARRYMEVTWKRLKTLPSQIWLMLGKAALISKLTKTG
eukprot:9223523-Pyramimonas_sp.AAC.1